jgi:hypothetical protein
VNDARAMSGGRVGGLLDGWGQRVERRQPGHHSPAYRRPAITPRSSASPLRRPIAG